MVQIGLNDFPKLSNLFLVANDNFFLEKNKLSSKNKRIFEAFKLDNVIDIKVDPQILYLKGLDYFYGHSVEQSVEKAFEYLSSAAAQGFAAAKYTIGFCYSVGDGLEQSAEKAFEYFSSAAAQGHVDAEYAVGLCYFEGRGVMQSAEKALEYLSLAAAKGRIDAEYAIGIIYSVGNGVEQNAEKAFEYLSSAAAQGFAAAKYTIGFCYSVGDGVEQSAEKAFEYFSSAAAQGHVDAEYAVGLCYLEDRGVEQSAEKAFEYFSFAAAQGHVDAEYAVGLCYFEGRGVMQSAEKAFEYLSLAAAQGHVDAKQKLIELAEDLKNEVNLRVKEENPNLDRNKASKTKIKPPQKLTRAYRRKNELPNPDKPSDSEENRATEKLQLRLSEELLNNIDKVANNLGINRTEWLQSIIETNIANNIIPQKFPEFQATKSIAVRLSPDLMKSLKLTAKTHSMKPSAWLRTALHAALADYDNKQLLANNISFEN